MTSDSNGACIVRTFGLTIASPHPLEMPASALPVDITVLETFGVDLATRAALDSSVEGIAFLNLPSMGSVRLRPDKAIELQLQPPGHVSLFRQLLSGPALGLLLHRSGLAILHGSSVAISGEGVVIIGPSGFGKSTLAAALRRRGHAHISDGMCVVRIGPTSAELIPGPPNAKLWPDAVLSLGERPERLTRVVPESEKRLLPVSGAIAEDSIPLRKIYSLHVEEGAATPCRITALAPALSTWELIRNYYLSEYIAREEYRHILERCSALTSRVEVHTLARTTNLGDLDRLAGAIEFDAHVCAPQPAEPSRRR